MLRTSRRAFLEGLAGVGAFAGMRAFAAPCGMFSKGKANLVFGIVTDIHVAQELDKDGRLTFVKNHGTETFRAALRWFDGKGVDAAGPSGGVRQEKRLLAYGYGFEADEPVVSQGAECSFEVAKLGPVPIRFSVWPCDCFGNRGKVLKGEFK